jgi:hypothetical protein
MIPGLLEIDVRFPQVTTSHFMIKFGNKPDQAFEVKSTTDTLKIVKDIHNKLNNQE